MAKNKLGLRLLFRDTARRGWRFSTPTLKHWNSCTLNYEQNIPLIYKRSPVPCSCRDCIFIHGIFDLRKNNEQHREQLPASSAWCWYRGYNKANVVLYQLWPTDWSSVSLHRMAHTRRLLLLSWPYRNCLIYSREYGNGCCNWDH